MLTPNGGVFGRNPKFNTVTSASTLAVTNGNIVMQTAGSGISFAATAQAAGMTSELLADYEEGTWTPFYSPATGTFASIVPDVTGAVYTKVGRLVVAQALIRTDGLDVTGASGALRIAGLPFTSASTGRGAVSIGSASAWAGDTPINGIILENATLFGLSFRATSNGADAVLDVSDMTTGATANQNSLAFVCAYMAA